MPHKTCKEACRLRDNCGTCSFIMRNSRLWIQGVTITRVCCDCVMHCEAVKRIEAH